MRNAYLFAVAAALVSPLFGCGDAHRAPGVAHASAPAGAANDVADASSPNAGVDGNAAVDADAFVVRAVQWAENDVEEASDLLALVVEAAAAAVASGDENTVVAANPNAGANGMAASASSAAASPNGLDPNYTGRQVRVGLQFAAYPTARGRLDGSLTATVLPKVVAAGVVDANALTVAFSYDVNRTLVTGEVVHVATQGNLLASSLGDPTDGQVVRSWRGTVRRTSLSGAATLPRLDLTVAHEATTVTDAHVGTTLVGRTVQASLALTDVQTSVPYHVALIDVARASASSCLCPSAGTAQLSVLGAAEGASAYTYAFGGCGSVRVDSAADAIAIVAAVPAIHGTVQWLGCRSD